jgi:SSS family solute:Na+ symporter
MLAQLTAVEIVVVIVYLLVVGYLGWLGFRRTQSATDYLVAGRKIHPFIMAMSYGATFISTSAIVGFGGVAGMFGMSLLWLTFLNIFAGIFIAFVLLGGPTRHMGHRLDAHTFPELLGRRYNSRFVQVFAGLVIFFFMPLYAAAVMIGASEFVASKFELSYEAAVLVFSVIVAAYVVIGGLKGVMYTDALQGSLMFLGMMVLLVWTYVKVGGVVSSHQELSQMGKMPSLFGGIGFKGWTEMPQFGWGAEKYSLWWIVVSTIVLGVGIGVLAQPQLSVRFMTVQSRRQLNRAVLVGGIFILTMTGVAFTVGSLSNLYFLKHEAVQGKLLAITGNGAGPKEWEWIVAKQERGLNLDANGKLINPLLGPDEKSVPCALMHLDTTGTGQSDTTLVYKGHGKAAAIMPAAQIEGLGQGADPTAKVGQAVVVRPRATAFTRAVVKNRAGKWMFNTDSIIPTYIIRALPGWFDILFLLTLLAAAMSTLSSQFHALGTSIGRDVWEQCTGQRGQTVSVTRIGIILGIVLAVVFSYTARGGYIVARATAIFFGLCASAFLPTFIGGLFFKRVTKPAAIASMIVGFVVTGLWLLFIKDTEARALGICHWLTGKHSLLLDKPSWPVVDPLVVALPLSLIVFLVLTLITKPPSDAHLSKCFAGHKAQR